jgi:hypothetical protein
MQCTQELYLSDIKTILNKLKKHFKELQNSLDEQWMQKDALHFMIFFVV